MSFPSDDPEPLTVYPEFNYPAEFHTTSAQALREMGYDFEEWAEAENKRQEERTQVESIRRQRQNDGLCPNCGGSLKLTDRIFRRNEHKDCAAYRA